MEIRVDSVNFEQLIVGAFFNDPAFIQHEDKIGLLDGGDPVAHDHDGSLPEVVAQMAEDFAFGIGIHRRKRVI